MKDIAVVGKGGFGREVRMLIDQINFVIPTWNFLGYYDDDIISEPIDGYPLLGTIKDINNVPKKLCLAIGIGSPKIRNTIFKNIINENISFPNLFHPDMIYDRNNFIFGIGNIVCANNIVSTNVKFGNFISINLACTIGHDVIINSYCSVNPGSNISGNVQIGERSVIGTNACILQGLTVGQDAVVGAGAVALRSVEDGMTVIGNPARGIRKSD
jgi:sugar O-acyltransferase (sialic acid O-acetyltransferase NeuD family)